MSLIRGQDVAEPSGGDRPPPASTIASVSDDTPSDGLRPDEPPPGGRLPRAPWWRRWWPAVVAVALVALVVPLTMYALSRGGADRPAAPSVTQSAPAGPDASTVPDTTQPSEATGGGGGASVPKGAIPRSELLNGTIRLAPWPPNSWWGPTSEPPVNTFRNVKFTNGRAVAGQTVITIEEVIYVDLNRGSYETMAQISARRGDTRIWQVTTFARDDNHRIVPSAVVLVTNPTGPAGTIKSVDGIRAAGHGRVEVQVGDDQVRPGVPRDTIQYQWRTYAWAGYMFRHVSGPSEFGRDLRFGDLTLQPTTLTLGTPVDAVRHGTLTVTVTIRITTFAAPEAVLFDIGLGDTGLTPEGSNWAGFTQTDGVWHGRQFRTSTAMTLQLGLSRPVGQDAATGELSVEVRPADASGNPVKDAWIADNSITVPIVISG